MSKDDNLRQMERELLALMSKRYKPSEDYIFSNEDESDAEYRERIAEEQSYMRDKL